MSMKRKIVIVMFGVMLYCIISVIIGIGESNNIKSEYKEGSEEIENVDIKEKSNESLLQNIKVLDDWRLILVNHNIMLTEDYEVKLSNIDSTRQFDSRAIDELNQMIKDMKKDGISNIWVQSAYRSIEYQKELFDNQVQKYINQGKTKEEAEKLTLQIINKPGTSEHNLGLAVDLNYVNYEFEYTKAFKWLQENAENYGFILRYKREKEDITKVDYEPWHWRYVGVENAKKMNELDMCLEEYIDYLTNSVIK